MKTFNNNFRIADAIGLVRAMRLGRSDADPRPDPRA